MPQPVRPYLLSEAESLRRIKFAQFRHQVPALVLLALAIAANTVFPRQNVYGWALAGAVIAIAWYLLVGFTYRFRQRVPQSPSQSLLSPVQGKVSFIRASGDATQLGIRKIWLDRVELRSPHSSCRLEDGNLFVEGPAGRVSFRFSFRKLHWFEPPDFRAGNIIGLAVGNGSCTVSFPGKPELAVRAGDPVDSADALIERFLEASIEASVGSPPQPPSVVISGWDEEER